MRELRGRGKHLLRLVFFNIIAGRVQSRIRLRVSRASVVKCRTETPCLKKLRSVRKISTDLVAQIRKNVALSVIVPSVVGILNFGFPSMIKVLSFPCEFAIIRSWLRQSPFLLKAQAKLTAKVRPAGVDYTFAAPNAVRALRQLGMRYSPRYAGNLKRVQ